MGNGVSGTLNGVPKASVSVQGSGIGSGLTATLVVASGNLNLVVKPPAVFSALSMSQSNSFGVGAMSVTMTGKVSSGVIYPAKNEAIGITINGHDISTAINDTTGDFSSTFNPKDIPYSSTSYNVVYTYGGNASLAPVTNNTSLAPNAFFAGDAVVGFFGGLNIYFTNTAGVSMFTWSSTNPALPVTDWTLESAMQEQPLNDGSGKSRYSLNVTPETALTYYLSGPSLDWPYLSPTAVQLVTNDFEGDYIYDKTNTSITVNGILGLPAGPVIVQQPISRTNLEGQNVIFNAIITGSQPLSYQWYFNTNTPLFGTTTNSPLLLANITGDNVGDYTVIATNQYGSVTSAPATLTVVSPPEINWDIAANSLQLRSVTVPWFDV